MLVNRIGGWAVCSVACAALLGARITIGADATTSVESPDPRATASAALAVLADKCDALFQSDPQLDLSEQARISRTWLRPRDPQRQYAFLPGEPVPKKTPDTVADHWQANFFEIRRKLADTLFAEARSALAAGRASDAYRLLHEALRENPEHADALAMLRSAETEAAIEVRRGAADDALLEWRSGRYWQVTSPHFEIVTNVARGDEARRIAGRLELLHTVWRQVFFDYWSEGARGTFSFVSRSIPAPRIAARHRVVVFRERQEYVVRLTALGVSGAGTSEGFYADEQKRSFFYAGDEAAYSTWYHEATHQLFQETGDAAPKVAADGHVWLVEGAAMYMESLEERDGVVAVGGFDARRLQYARQRRLVDGFHMPLAELARMGRKELAGHDDIRQLYSESCGLVHFLFDGEGGKHRAAAIGLLKEIYAGRARPDSLAALTGVQPEQLDAAYAVFLADVDDEDLAQYLSPPERITALALPRTNVTDAGLAHLANCTELLWLDLSDTKVTDDGFAHLARATKLERLSLRHTAIGDASLERIAAFPRLDDLNLAHTGVTDAGLSRLAELRSLTALWLEGTAAGDAALTTISHMGQLELLDLAATRVGDAGMTDVGKLLKLQALYLSHTGVSDAGLAPLKRLQSLQLVQLDGTKVTSAGADELKASLKDARIVLRLE
jgi:hypothetical protein